MNLRVLGAALLAALVACPAAAGHGDGAARGYRSRVTSVEPSVSGLSVEVLAGDDQLRLENRSGRELVIHDYDGEPYLRFGAGGGVFRNANSPATYLNDDRYGAIAVPASASKRSTPRWERLTDDNDYAWHDHRIHWMSKIDPPQVRAAKDRPHHVFDWRVPGTAGNEPVVIKGRLDYTPPPKSSFSPFLVAPLVALPLAGGIFWWTRRRRA